MNFEPPWGSKGPAMPVRYSDEGSLANCGKLIVGTVTAR